MINTLRRWPDRAAPSLQTWVAVDRPNDAKQPNRKIRYANSSADRHSVLHEPVFSEDAQTADKSKLYPPGRDQSSRFNGIRKARRRTQCLALCSTCSSRRWRLENQKPDSAHQMPASRPPIFLSGAVLCVVAYTVCPERRACRRARDLGGVVTGDRIRVRWTKRPHGPNGSQRTRRYPKPREACFVSLSTGKISTSRSGRKIDG